MHESFSDSNEFCEILEIDGQEVLISENSVAIIMYNGEHARYNHFLVNPDGENPTRHFPTERRDLQRWVGRVAPIASERPHYSVREEFWDKMDEVEMDEADFAERGKVMAAKAKRAQAEANQVLAESEDLDQAFAELLG